MISYYFRNKQGFIVMYDCTNEESIRRVPAWLEQIKNKSSVKHSLIMVLANKIDQVDQRERALEDELLCLIEVKYPEIACREVSILGNVLVDEAMAMFATLLRSNINSYV